MVTKNNEAKLRAFKFDRRFWVMLAVSYVVFFLLVILPFLFGYIDLTILAYGVAGLVESLVLMVIVWRLNRVDPLLRQRIGYLAFGGWLGLFISVIFGIILFGHQIISAIGSWAHFFLVIIASPLVGALIGYLAARRKDSSV